MSHVTAPATSVTCFAVAAPGLEPLVAAELRALGAVHPLAVEEFEPGGVGFATDVAGLYAANLHLRVASRVLVRVGSFHAAAFRELERHARQLPWTRFIRTGQAVAFRVTSRKSRLYHQEAVAERLLTAAAAEAGVGQAGMEGGAQEFVVRLFRDQCTVSADASGELLHRRGYRLVSAKAPLRETLAAAMLAGAGWSGQAPLVDPMCGSGTIPIEAAMLARRIPPGVARSFAFERWPEFDGRAWSAVRDLAREQIRPTSPVRILGSDRDAGAVQAAAGNAERAGVAADIEWRRAAISAIDPPGALGWIVTNPPYGIRVGERKRLRDLYAQLGNVLRAKCPGWEVAILTAHAELERQIGLPLQGTFDTTNGGIRVRLVRARVP
ncbi:MAG TPA: class I SAM-dependent RNA methyltransferase [Gemmatimonadales bacterium]|nr:class I SAM-dependent RNA methyltransferase [Gemmatimonadales bacterium]